MSILVQYIYSNFDIRVLGTAGQNVQDIYKVSTFEDHLEILEHTMRWSHIAPTAPDTLGCYPYYDKDPLFWRNVHMCTLLEINPSMRAKFLTQIVHHEMDNRAIDVLGISECRWTGSELRNRFQVLADLDDVEESWKEFKTVVSETSEKVLGFKSRKKVNWISEKSRSNIREYKETKSKVRASEGCMEKKI
ncbi:DNA polymerase delta subunit 2 [Desmophyllum pertusum]|uniref:DNA polymerase delta subunit 2 n=1 Tax=Desmophyllum pertusum TaxID=174260 RepID=A0A9W9ZRQ4_9CNID|nr:DNA polymerase delta subunit 2 [Desmophyllum pertusum]